jgi:2-polyprenyl-6-methoxyphenol hydroxylase-like FAD-dependent oxidoreductase
MGASPVLIVGGGIGGLATGLALRRRGIDVQVFEQAERLREVGAGLTVWSNAIKALQSLGVADAILPRASVVERVEIRTSRGGVLGENDVGEMGRRLGAPSVIVHRGELLHALASALGDDVVTVGARFERIEQDASGVTAHFQDGTQRRGALLIGADGLYSTVREHLHGVAHPRYAGYTCWRGLATFETELLPQGLGFEAWGRGSRFAVHHCGIGQTFWYATKNAPEGSGDGPRGRKQDVIDLFRDWHEPIPSVIAATAERAILKNDIVDRDPITRWGDGRVTLLGDAAHPTTPNFGQGACLAMEDAVVLADCLKNDGIAASALRTYEARRRERTRSIVRESRSLGAVSQWENSVACAVRDWIIRSGVFRGATLKQFEMMLRFEPPSATDAIDHAPADARQ